METFHCAAPKAVLKGGFSRSYCCYGNVWCHENDDKQIYKKQRHKVFTIDWAVFFDIMIIASSDKEWL